MVDPRKRCTHMPAAQVFQQLDTNGDGMLQLHEAFVRRVGRRRHRLLNGCGSIIGAQNGLPWSPGGLILTYTQTLVWFKGNLRKATSFGVALIESYPWWG